jgi:multisubunit Na+/H+ antiporter MnhB subunit
VSGRQPGGVPEGPTGVLTRMVARLLLLPTLMISAALLVGGYVQPGDGFSAGVVAALALLLQYLAFGRECVERLLPVRWMGMLTFVGLLLALLVAAVPLFLGDEPLTHYPHPGGKVIYLGTLELITAVAFDVGIFLLVLGFAAGAVQLVAGASDHAESEGEER